MKLTAIEKEYFKELYSNTNGFVKIMCGKNRKGIFVPASEMAFHPEKYIENNRINTTNTMMSLSTFIKKGYATVDNINTICSMAIDIDYQFMEKEELIDAKEAYKMLTMQWIEQGIFLPVPTYVEYSHRLRFIYIFESPICLRTDKQTKMGILKFMERIAQEICNNINALDQRWNAEIEQATKFLRVPESFNIRFVESSAAPGHYIPEYKHYVSIIKPVNSKKWTLQELSDYVLADLPDWYDDWKKKKHTKKSGKHIGLFPMLDSRLAFLEKLQETGYGKGYREIMCFLHWNFSLQKNMNEEDAIESVKKFNKNFAEPLPEKELLSKSRPRKKYFYSNNRLINMFMPPASLHAFLSSFNKKEYDKQYSSMRRRKIHKIREKAGLLKSQVMKKLSAKAKKLREAGNTISHIAEELNISVSTVKRYLKAA